MTGDDDPDVTARHRPSAMLPESAPDERTVSLRRPLPGTEPGAPDPGRFTDEPTRPALRPVSAAEPGFLAQDLAPSIAQIPGAVRAAPRVERSDPDPDRQVRVRRRLPRPGRARVIAVIAALAVVPLALTYSGPQFGVLIGIAVVLLVGALARWRGRWATEHVVDRLASGPDAVGDVGPVGEAGDPTAGAGLGTVVKLVPGVHVAEAADRHNPTIGTIGDGQGYAAVVELLGVGTRVPVSALVEWAAADRAELAGLQILVEQVAAPQVDLARVFGPTAVYQQLPISGLPISVRCWVVLRHEPLAAPEAVRRRGGGTTGSRTALVAAVARLRVRLAELGLRTAAADEAELRVLLPALGDPAATAREGIDVWVSGDRGHSCLAVDSVDPDDLASLLATCAETPADRSVLALNLDWADDGSDTVGCRAVVRLVAGDGARLTRARSALTDTGLAQSLSDRQAAGMIATLPLGGGARSLTTAFGLGRG